MGILQNIKEWFAYKPIEKTETRRVTKGTGIENYNYICNLKEMPDQFLIIDIETTGLNPIADSIIEVAIIKCVNGEIVNRYSRLINPGHIISNEVTSINGITNAMLRKQPRLHQVIQEIYNIIKNEDIIMGYNVKFDLDFINVALMNNGYSIVEVKVFDVLSLVRETLSSREVPNRKLETLKNYFKINTVSHRALSDCETTFEVLKNCLKLKNTREMEYRAKQEEKISKFSDNEKLFISTLRDELSKIGLDKSLSYNVLSDKTINFDINDMQIGRVKLNGRKFKMQILDRNNVLWLDIDDVTEAMKNIKHWIKYAKKLTNK